MPEQRQFPRITVGGVHLTVKDDLRPDATRHRVLNVSERGVMVENLDMPAGRRLTFALEGGGLRCSGYGHIAHDTGADGAAGISVDHWHGPADDIRALSRRAPATAITAQLHITDWA